MENIFKFLALNKGEVKNVQFLTDKSPISETLKDTFFTSPLFNAKNLKMFSINCIAEILLPKSHDTELINRVISFPVRHTV